MSVKAPVKKRIILLISIIIVLLLIVLIINSFINNIRQNEIALADNTLYDTAMSNVRAVQFIFDQFIASLKTAALAIEQYDNFHSPEALNFLNSIAKKQGYARLAIDYPDGQTYTSDGYIFNMSKFGYLDKIKNGETFIWDVTYSISDGTPIVGVFVPLHDKNSKPVASLRLALTTEHLTDILNLNFYNGEGYYHLVDRNGLYVAAGESSHALLMGMNFFDSLKYLNFDEGYSAQDIINVFEKGEDCYVKYSFDDENRYAYCAPVGINNWTLMTIVPKNVVIVQEGINIQYAIIMSVHLLVLAILVFAYFYTVQRKARMRAVLNDKCFRILAEQTGKVIFEWDFAINKISSMTNFISVFGRDSVTKSSASEALNTGMIHGDDTLIFKEVFENVSAGKNVENVKFRIKDAHGEYNWCNLSAVVINDHKGRPFKSIGSLENINDQVEKEEILKQKAEKDQLTGLYNKLTTEFLIKQAFTDYSPEDGSYALFIIDIDNFKNVNDRLGHLYGDIVLAELADYLKPIFRSNDILGRIGGDEFFVFLRNLASSDIIFSKAQEICRLFEKTYSENGVSCKISASIGIAIYPEHGMDFDTLYKNADTALYISKEKGKNNFTVYDKSQHVNYISSRTDIDNHENNISKKPR